MYDFFQWEMFILLIPVFYAVLSCIADGLASVQRQRIEADHIFLSSYLVGNHTSVHKEDYTS